MTLRKPAKFGQALLRDVKQYAPNDQASGLLDNPFDGSPGSERDTLRQRTYSTLRYALMAGAFRPGHTVSLRSLAASLGTSSMPVRDAVSRLIAEHALVMLPNRSVIVPRMTRARFIDLFRARQVIEGMAAEAAAARVTPNLLRQLSAVEVELRKRIVAGDLEGALLGNMRFHFTLYRAGQTEVLLQLIETLWLQAGPFLAYSVTIPGVRWTSRHHKTLLAALRSANAAGVRSAIELDIDETFNQLLRKADFNDAPVPTSPRALKMSGSVLAQSG